MAELKVGNLIGGIFVRKLESQPDEWYVYYGKITRITSNTKGTKVYSKQFYPLDTEEILDNTKQMEEADGWINVRDVVILDDRLLEKCRRWVTWANQNPDKVSMFAGG